MTTKQNQNQSLNTKSNTMEKKNLNKTATFKRVEIDYFVTEDNVHFTPRRINLTFEYLASYFRDGVDIEDALTREHIVKRLIEDETTEKNILLHSVEITKRKLF